VTICLHDSLKCSVELADVVSMLLNISFASGQVHTNWKMALVTPVPSFGDFRPISVTLILSGIAEKIVVKGWLNPAIPSHTITDQCFATNRKYNMCPYKSTPPCLSHVRNQ